MNTEALLEEALKLKANEKFVIVDSLLKSLDQPDEHLESIWVTEAENRLKAYRQGKLEGIPMEEVFQD